MTIHVHSARINTVATVSFLLLILISWFPFSEASSDTPAPSPLPPAVQVPIPAPPPDLVGAKKNFTKNCTLCHGDSGQGAMGPKLQNITADDAKMIGIITNGSTKGMPAWGKKLTTSQISDLVAYIHTLGKK